MDGSFGKNLEFCTLGAIEPPARPPPPSCRLDRLASPSLTPHSTMLACGRCQGQGGRGLLAAGVYENHAL